MSYGKKILTIDDDEDINNFLKVKLKEDYYDVRCTTNTKDFLQEIVTFKPHLLLVDLNLEGQQGFGYKIIETVRSKLGPDLIIFIMSRRNNHSDIIKGLELGANDYITKPIDDIILITKIKLFLGEELGPKQDLAFYKVPKQDSDIEFHIPLKVQSIDETSIRFFTKSFIAKNSLITLEGALAKYLSPLEKLRFLTKDVKIDKAHNGYIVEVHLDPNEHTKIIRNIRKMLLKANHLEEDAEESLI